MATCIHTLARRGLPMLLSASMAAAAAAAGMLAARPGEVVAQAPEPVADPVKDVAIAVSVKRALTEDPDLARTSIDVDAVAGVVVLRGRVPELSLRERAARLAQAVYGVRRVDNQLTVSTMLS